MAKTILSIKDIPKPHKREWDDKRLKRNVFVGITSWKGVSIGAKHYYVNIYEDDNPIVFEGRCFYFSDDPLCKGITLKEKSFKRLSGAIEWAVLILIDKFPKHRIECNGGLVSTKELKQRIKAVNNPSD